MTTTSLMAAAARDDVDSVLTEDRARENDMATEAEGMKEAGALTTDCLCRTLDGLGSRSANGGGQRTDSNKAARDGNWWIA